LNEQQGAIIEVDLAAQTNGDVHRFDIDAFAKYCLLNRCTILARTEQAALRIEHKSALNGRHTLREVLQARRFGVR